jgi:outer membrane immunogenic protein
MKKYLLGIMGLVALGSPASAADIAPYTKAPPPAPPPIYDWTGFYIGANGGWGQTRGCVDFVTDVFGTTAGGCADRSGGFVGGQIGYRWQTNQFVFGLEAQGDWADLSRTRVSVFDPSISITGKTDGIGLFTGQLGWAFNQSLLYVKGGAAVTHNSLDIFDNFTGIGLASAGHTRWGGALGVGWEYGFGPGWSVGLEYDHLWVGHDDTTFTGVVLPVVPVTTLLGTHVSQDVDMVAVRFNYRFGGYGGYGSPPARY